MAHSRRFIDYTDHLTAAPAQSERDRVIGCAHRHASNGSPLLRVISLEYHVLYMAEYHKATLALTAGVAA